MITLPSGHMLDLYQKSFKNYDKKLPAIARLVEKKYPSMSIVDIGANIGDTAVALRDACNASLICVEGNSIFLPLLKANLSKLPGIICIVPKFIGSKSPQNLGRVVTINGTAHIEREIKYDYVESSQENISFITYEELLATNANLPEVRLIKTDTDGFDFKIILTSINKIAATLPIIFIEFDPLFSPENERLEALYAMGELIDRGYSHYVIYDNFGNYLISFSESAHERFKDLFCFLEQSRSNGGGIIYLDVCCFSEKDIDIFNQLVDAERTNKLIPLLAS